MGSVYGRTYSGTGEPNNPFKVVNAARINDIDNHQDYRDSSFEQVSSDSQASESLLRSAWILEDAAVILEYDSVYDVHTPYDPCLPIRGQPGGFYPIPVLSDLGTVVDSSSYNFVLIFSVQEVPGWINSGGYNRYLAKNIGWDNTFYGSGPTFSNWPNLLSYPHMNSVDFLGRPIPDPPNYASTLTAFHEIGHNWCVYWGHGSVGPWDWEHGDPIARLASGGQHWTYEWVEPNLPGIMRSAPSSAYFNAFDLYSMGLMDHNETSEYSYLLQDPCSPPEDPNIYEITVDDLIYNLSLAGGDYYEGDGKRIPATDPNIENVTTLIVIIKEVNETLTQDQIDLVVDLADDLPGDWNTATWGRSSMDVTIYPPPLPLVIFVDANATGGDNGSSWANAHNDLQDALEAARTELSIRPLREIEIRVALGTYLPDQGTNDREATFQLISGVVLQGGYAGTGNPDPNARDVQLYETILSGDLDGDDGEITSPEDLLADPNRAENSFHVVTVNDVSVMTFLDGFVITGGNANGNSPNDCGGALYSDSGNLTINNCTFLRNCASSTGGGIYSKPDNLILKNCTLKENYSTSSGGGLYSVGGTTDIENCTFDKNICTQYGGGACCLSNVTEIANSIFKENDSKKGGGVGNLTIYDPWPETQISGCSFIGNSSLQDGAGIYIYRCNTNLESCIIARNDSSGNGGGVYSWIGEHSVVNCTFNQNSASNRGGGIYNHVAETEIINSILWQNLSPDGHEVAVGNASGNQSIVTIVYSDVDGGPEEIETYDGGILDWGIGNFDIDPCFADTDANDFHLKSQSGRWDSNSENWVTDAYTSRCIDAGNPGSLLSEEANDGNNIRINMGAYGGTAEASIPPYDWAILSDINNDGTADFVDFAHLGAIFTDEGEELFADFDRDGDADFADIRLLTEDWLDSTSWL
jgi:hypothetical protein